MENGDMSRGIIDGFVVPGRSAASVDAYNHARANRSMCADWMCVSHTGVVFLPFTKISLYKKLAKNLNTSGLTPNT